MLKWRKCGGSQPEGLDRIDSSTRSSHRTFSLREKSVDSPRAVNRKKGDLLITRSFCASDNKKTEEILRSQSELDLHSLKHKNVRNLISEYRSSSPVSQSPFENINLEDIYNNFDKAHAEFSISPVSTPEDGDCHEIFVVAPTKSRQNSRHEKQSSPTGLPCIEEGVENDDLSSIADSGICEDEEYAKHYFEPLKFHDENEALYTNELLRRQSSCSPDDSNLTSFEHHKINNGNDDINTDFECKHKTHRNFDILPSSELTSSQESDSSHNGKCENHSSNQTHTPDDIVSHPMISSMLWNGNTSNQPPSSTDIYSTMPPNRYGQRNKDFITQISCDQKKPACPKEFKVSLDVSHYGPDEILVTLEDGKLVVNGKHFSESEYGFESLQFHRRYPIPEGIKKPDIKSTITDDGILIIIGRVSESQESKMKSQETRFSQYDNMDSPRIKKGERTSPTLSRRSLPTSDYSEDSRSRLSEDSTVSENEFRETDEETFLLKVNCRGYDPQDLELKIQNRELIIHGRQKICSVENGHERIRHKEFTKRYSVPRNANCQQIRSNFTEDEQLVVEIRKSISNKKEILREDILDED